MHRPHIASDANLSAHDVLDACYAMLADRVCGRHVTLDRRAFITITDDSDHHRTRKGSMVYGVVHVCEIAKRSLIIAFGTSCNSFLSRPYDCDIMAVPLPPGVAARSGERQRIRVEMENANAALFQKSLVFAHADGRLTAVPSSPMGTGFMSDLHSMVREYAVIDRSVDRSAEAKRATYRPQLIPPLTELMVCALQTIP